MNAAKHPFAITLGAGPFRFVGSYDMGPRIAAINAGTMDSATAWQDAPKVERGLGTCAHCGHAILTVCVVQCGDGKRYGVGSDCIRKVAAEGDVGAITAMEREIRNAAKEKRRKAEMVKCEALRPAYELALVKLASLPHPNDYFAGQGKTLADYYRYISKNSKVMQGAIARAQEA